MMIEDKLERAREELLVARIELNDEIRNYPRPISGCDAQFNHLMALRAKTDAALTALTREVVIPTSRNPELC